MPRESRDDGLLLYPCLQRVGATIRIFGGGFLSTESWREAFRLALVTLEPLREFPAGGLWTRGEWVWVSKSLSTVEYPGLLHRKTEVLRFMVRTKK